MKKLASIFFLLVFVSCGVTVNYDYEKNTDFSKYTSYSYFTNMNTGLSELDANRFFNALNDAMKLKGLTLSEDSDFIINIQSTTFQEIQNQPSLGVGMGTGGGGVSVGIPLGQQNISRQIAFEFVDAQTNQLFWQAISSESDMPNNNPEEREAKFKTLIAKVLEGYPPKK